MKVRFSNVGRGKKSWVSTLPSLHYDHLYAAVKHGGGLMSNDIDFDIDEDAGTGKVFAGMRPVGSFTYEADAAELN